MKYEVDILTYKKLFFIFALMNINVFFKMLVLFIVCFFCSCNNGFILSTKRISIEKEFELLSSEQELNSLITRSEEGVVDWQLSKEFAQLTLDEFIRSGEFPKNSVLWDFPIIIYDSYGVVRYYEFRVMENGSIIAAIVGNAQEKLGGPISRIFNMTGYSDNLVELYESGVLTEGSLPRIIDNDYPSYSIALVNITKNGGITVDNIINPETGNKETDFVQVMTVEDLIENNPKVVTNVDISFVNNSLENYKNDIAELWNSAKLNKGNLNNFIVRGSAPNPRKQVDESKVAKAIKQSRIRLELEQEDHPVSYTACGATASGFLLDFLHENNIQYLEKWSKLDLDKRKEALYSAMEIDSSGITWPDKLGRGVEEFSDYKISLALGVVPNTSIENNLPGINLRGLDTSSKDSKKGGMHYRDVVAYREDGWWIFTWTSIKVIDGNNIENGWEEYNPFFHLFSYNLVEK